MPDISDSEFRSFVRFQNLGTPEEVERKIRDLEKDNQKQRDEIRERDEKLKGLPPEGAVVLTGEEATAYPTVKELVALGKPEEIKAKLTEGEQSKVKLAELERTQKVHSAATAAGYKPTVLEKLPGADKLVFDVKEETVDGKPVKVAYVTGPEQGATPKKLTDHADAEWKDFLPSLQQTTTGGTQQQGRTFAAQAASGAAADPKSLVDQQIEKNQKAATAPNALRPAAAAS